LPVGPAGFTKSDIIMIIDSFIFYNEFDLLEGRLEYLNDTVDCFVIVEADVTHSGKNKKLNFPEQISRYRKYLNKILYFVYSPDLQNQDKELLPYWVDHRINLETIESAQRNYISTAAKLFHSDDYFLISDLDEIPNKDIIKHLANHKKNHIYRLGQTLFYYNFRQKFVDVWPGTIMTQQHNLLQHKPHQLRYFPQDQVTMIYNAGYHLSYWSDAAGIQNKIQNFCHHREFNKQEITDLEKINLRVKLGKDIYGRFNVDLQPCSVEDIDPEIYKIFHRYSKI
jgi:beta-1,4-mannosyl-glycoprotein beta-1,4-N-acetylglucosaminyltransferase